MWWDRAGTETGTSPLAANGQLFTADQSQWAVTPRSRRVDRGPPCLRHELPTFDDASASRAPRVCKFGRRRRRHGALAQFWALERPAVPLSLCDCGVQRTRDTTINSSPREANGSARVEGSRAVSCSPSAEQRQGCHVCGRTQRPEAGSHICVCDRVCNRFYEECVS